MTCVINININETSYDAATRQIQAWAQEGNSHYICVANVHTSMEAHDSKEFREVINNADLVTPDGMPLVWMMRWKGTPRQTRVYGPTLMLRVLEVAISHNIPVGFYGSTPEVIGTLIDKMQARYPGLNVVFSCSPPFGKIDSEEDAETVDKINRSGARILFVGLGCPKQEIWMADHRGRVNSVMLGVGAAFDFHAGMKPQAPSWMQAVGLEWLFRLIGEPRRLWRRYLYHNPRFIILAIADLLGLFR